MAGTGQEIIIEYTRNALQARGCPVDFKAATLGLEDELSVEETFDRPQGKNTPNSDVQNYSAEIVNRLFTQEYHQSSTNADTFYPYSGVGKTDPTYSIVIQSLFLKESTNDYIIVANIFDNISDNISDEDDIFDDSKPYTIKLILKKSGNNFAANYSITYCQLNISNQATYNNLKVNNICLVQPHSFLKTQYLDFKQHKFFHALSAIAVIGGITLAVICFANPYSAAAALGIASALLVTKCCIVAGCFALALLSKFSGKLVDSIKCFMSRQTIYQLTEAPKKQPGVKIIGKNGAQTSTIAKGACPASYPFWETKRGGSDRPKKSAPPYKQQPLPPPAILGR